MVIFEGPDPPTPKLADVLRQSASALSRRQCGTDWELTKSFVAQCVRQVLSSEG